MSTEKISIKTGPPVEGNNFYGREKELQYAWEYHIEKGTSLLLSAPRRVGKSSFSKRMLKMAEQKGWKTLYLDLQGISTEGEFVRLFKEKLKSANWWDKVGNAILNLFESIKFDKGSINSNVWRNNNYGRIRQLIEQSGELLIVIDELSIYLNHILTQDNGKEKVEFFLEWLRKFRQISGTTVRWIFCSSVGIENFTTMNQLSGHLNDVPNFLIGAFSEYEAKDFISKLDVDEKVQFTEEDIQYILDKLDWYLPYFIQLLVEKINSLIYMENKKLSKETIDEAYNLLLIGKDLNHWDDRLKYYYEYEDNARKILKLCAVPTGRNRDELLASLASNSLITEAVNAETFLGKLLYMLQNDGYLMEYDNKYFFRSSLLRDFWNQRYIL